LVVLLLVFLCCFVAAEQFAVQKNELIITSNIPNSFVKVQFGDVGKDKLAIEIFSAIGEVDESVANNAQHFDIDVSSSYQETSVSSAAKLHMISPYLGCLVSLVIFKGNQRFLFLLAFLGLALFSAAQFGASYPTVLVTLDRSLVGKSVKVVGDRSLVAAEVIDSFGSKIECSLNGDSFTNCISPLCSLEQDQCFSPLADNLLTVGVLYATSGDFGETGIQMLRALELALENNELPVYFIHGDTKTEANQAVSLAQEMYDSGVRMFIGPITSEEAVNLYSWSKRVSEEVLFISPSVSLSKVAHYDNFISMQMQNYAGIDSLLYFMSGASGKAVAIYRDDEFGRENIDLLESKIGLSSIQLADSMSYHPEITSATASQVVAELANLVQTNEANIVIAFSFDEISLLLEAAADYPELTSKSWIGIGFLLSSAVETNAQALSVAQEVSLTSIGYRGAKIGYSELRKTLLSEIANEFDVSGVSNIVTTSYDTAVLLLESARISRTNDIAALRDGLLISSNYTFGATGWLGLNSESGFRDTGEYLVSFIAPAERNPLHIRWVSSQIISLNPSLNPVFGEFQIISSQIGSFLLSEEFLRTCTQNPIITISYKNAAYKDQSIELRVSDVTGDIYVPLYDEVNVHYNCDGSLMEIWCPSFLFGGEGLCRATTSTGLSRGTASDFLRCTGSGGTLCFDNDRDIWTQVGCVVSAATVCTADALDSCCENLGLSWCCN